MEEKTTTLSHDSALNNGKESLVNTENNSPESQVQGDVDETGALGSGEGSGSGATSSKEITFNQLIKKRGRGRPRKYEISNGAPINSGEIESLEAFPPLVAKRARGRPKGTGKLQALASFGGYVDTAGGCFTPHVLLVHTGEDLVNKIGSFCAKVSRSVCVLAASGALSSVTLCRPNSSVGTLTYEGRFEILTLSGTSVVAGEVGTRRKTGLLSVSLANSHGQVFGGSVAGPLVAAGPGPTQLIVASFKQNISLEIRRKYPAGTSIAANIYGNSQMVEVSIEDRSLMDDPPPATVTVRADPPKADCIISSDNNTIGLNNLQKADPVKAENNELNNLRDTGLYQK